MYISCPACQTAVEQTATTCPDCGAAIATPVVSAPKLATWQDAFQAGLDATGREEYQAAIKSFGKALIDAPEEELAACYAMRGYAFLCMQQFDRALNDCDRAIDANPHDAEAFAWRGSAHAGLKRWRKCVEDFLAALQLSPEHAQEYKQVALNYTEQALAEMRQQVRDGNSTAQMFQDRGFIYKFRGDFEKAIRDFGQSLDLEKKLVSSYVSRAECFLTLGENRKAVEDCARATKLGHRNAEVYLLRATALENLGAIDKAVNDLTKAIKRDPECNEAYRRRGQLFESTGEYAAAVADYSVVIERNESLDELYGRRGTCFASSDDYASAVEDFTRSLELVAADTATLVMRGDAYLQLGEVERALADFDDAVTIDSVDPAALRGRGAALAASGKLDEALNELNKAIRLDGQYGPAYATRSKVLLELKRMDDALADCNAALELGGLGKESADMFYRRGVLLAEKKQYSQAIKDFDESLRQRDGHAGTLVWRGTTLGHLKQWRAALDDLRLAQRTNPANSEHYTRIGKPIAQKAVEYFGRIIERENRQAHGYRDRAIAHAFLGDVERAIQDFETALRFEPADAESLLGRAAILAAEERWEAAAADYTALIEQDTADAEMYYQRAVCYHKMAQTDDALADITSAIEQAPHRPDYYLLRAETLSDDDLEKAIEDVARAIEIDPESAAPYLRRGLLHASRAKYDEAIADLTASLERDTQNAQAFFQRGEARIHKNQFENALHDFQQAIGLDPLMVDAYCSRALMLARQRKFEAALIFLSKSLRQFRDNTTALAALLECRAKLHYNAGRFRKALADYIIVLELKPDGHNFSQTLYGCGLAFFQLAQKSHAEERFAKALKLDPQFHRAKAALRWLAGKDKQRPAEMNAPPKQPTPRPDAVRNAVEVRETNDKWNAKPPWDQWILQVQDEVEFGPVTKPTLDRWCAEGRVAATALLSRLDWEDWKLATDVYPELDEQPSSEETEPQSDTEFPDIVV